MSGVLARRSQGASKAGASQVCRHNPLAKRLARQELKKFVGWRLFAEISADGREMYEMGDDKRAKKIGENGGLFDEINDDGRKN